MRDTFGRYMTQQVSDAILRGDVRLGGDKRYLTVLYVHLLQFKRLVLTLPTASLVSLMNDYFGAIIPAVLDHAGVVDKFIGGDVVVTFGAPVKDPNHPLKAVLAGLEVQASAKAFNAVQQDADAPALTIGVGIDTGLAIAGNIGTQARMEYTVLGRPMIVAARLAKFAAGLNVGLLVGPDTAQDIGATYQCDALPERLQLEEGLEVVAYTVG